MMFNQTLLTLLLASSFATSFASASSYGPWTPTKYYQGRIIIKSNLAEDDNNLFNDILLASPSNQDSSSATDAEAAKDVPTSSRRGINSEMTPRSYNPGRSFGSRTPPTTLPLLPTSSSSSFAGRVNNINNNSSSGSTSHNMIRTLIRTRTSPSSSSASVGNNNRIAGNNNNNNNSKRDFADAADANNNNIGVGSGRRGSSNPKLATGPVIEFTGSDTGLARINNNNNNKPAKDDEKVASASGFLGTTAEDVIFPDVDGLVKGEFVSKKVIVALSCEPNEFKVNFNFTNPFRGVIQSGDTSSKCKIRGNGRKLYSLSVPHNDCGTKHVSSSGSFFNTLFIRYHPSLEMEGDQLKSIVCKFGTGSLSVESGTGLRQRKGIYVILRDRR